MDDRETQKLTAPSILAILAGLHVEIAILIFCAIILMGTGKTKGPVFDAVVRKAALFSITTALFVAALVYHILPLYLASSAFVACATLLLSHRPDWRDVLYGVVSGLVLGAVLQYVFTQILYIDLNG